MGQALTEREIEAVVREVTDEEVAFYQEYGWVMMKQLVDPEFVTEAPDCRPGLAGTLRRRQRRQTGRWPRAAGRG